MAELDDHQSVNLLSLFLARVRHHAARLAAGDDPLDVDVTVVGELRKFLTTAGILLPSNAFLFALSDVLSGGDPLYFKARRRPRPPLHRHQQLVGLVTFLIQTLIAGKVFTAGAATEVVTHELNVAGHRQPNGKLFTVSTVARWREQTVHHAKTGDPAYDLLVMQQRVLLRLHPDHRQWNEARLREWLAEFCRRPAFSALSRV
jgi:hypothetical protein